jgi:hypothetical protein
MRVLEVEIEEWWSLSAYAREASIPGPNVHRPLVVCVKDPHLSASQAESGISIFTSGRQIV